MYKADGKSDKGKRRIRLTIQWKMVLVGLAVVAVFLGLILGYILPGLQSSLMAEKENKTKEHVQAAWTLLDNAYKQEQSGVLTEKDAQALAIQEIRALRYGDDSAGYFWLNDARPYMIMHPTKPEMNGTDLTNYKDPNGKALFVDMVNICKQSGQGFVNYMWQYGTDTKRIEPKISYVKEFTPWGWIVGTGIYTVDVNQAISAKRNQYLLIGGILAVVCIVFVFFFSRIISKNIRKAADIANKLNNPLTGVVALSQLLLESGVPDEIKEDLEAISSEGQRAANVVRNLLSFARSHTMSAEPIEINMIISQVLNLRAYEHRVNNIMVTTHLASNLPKIIADRFQMQQVFLNIVLNAEQAMIESKGRGNLTVTTEPLDSIIRISFADDGPGISPDIMNRIFDPFFTTKDVGKGTGLGLSICYGIITSQGGRIYAESRPGNGATFIIELPINTH